MDYEQEESFFDVYRMGLKTKGWTYTTLYNALYEKKHVRINMNILEHWGEKKMIPLLDNARVVLDVLDITATEDEIREMISKAYDEKVPNYTDNRWLSENLRVFLPDLSEDKSLEKIREELEERIYEMKSDEAKNFNNYVIELIKYDLENHILPSEDQKAICIGKSTRQC